MVDPIGIKAGTIVDRRLAPIAPTEAVAPTPSVRSDEAPAADVSSATFVTHALAAQPPVDAERVALIRKAVQEGRFPLLPATVADRLLALKLEWNSNDEA